MNKPVTKTESELVERINKSFVEADITKRWSEGIEHHPKAKELAREIGSIDWLFGGDSFSFEFGGDGDNGEQLTYLLDILFDLRDAEAK